MRLKEKNLLQKFATTLKMFSAQGAKKVEYGILSKIWYVPTLQAYPYVYQPVNISTAVLFSPVYITTLWISICFLFNPPIAQWVKRWPTDLAVPNSSHAQSKIFSTVKQGSVAHSLSLSSAHHPDMTEILWKRT